MSDDSVSDKPFAALSGALLARKGSAAGFAPAPDAAPPAPAPGPDRRTRSTILVAEDDLLNRILMIELFEAHGYATLQAEDGEEALRAARAEAPDLIVMDIQLPVLSGLDAVRQLKSDGALKTIPVIGVSAMGQPLVDETIRGAGFDDFLAKPFTLDGMLGSVSRFLA